MNKHEQQLPPGERLIVERQAVDDSLMEVYGAVRGWMGAVTIVAATETELGLPKHEDHREQEIITMFRKVCADDGVDPDIVVPIIQNVYDQGLRIQTDTSL